MFSTVNLPTNETNRVGKTSGAPLTSLAHLAARPGPFTPFASLDIFAGCWDKQIVKYSFQVAPNMKSGQMLTGQTSFPAHSDFVKCLLIAPTADNQNVLISGGADGVLNFWTTTGIRLATLRPNCRAIESIALDPLSPPHEPIIFFSTSQREIFQVTLPSMAEFSSANLKTSPPIIAHETSVYKIYFDDDGDLWTASADKTAKHLSRDNSWSCETTLIHPDFVRDVIVHNKTKAVITACRDEEIRVWNSSTAELLHIFTGHFDAVTGLAISGDTLLSISLDATLRRWSIAPADLKKEIENAKNPDLLAENPEPDVDMGMLTAEEEAELNALMEEEDEEALGKMATD